MANIKVLKRRIKSATSIAQITKAMEMVAASKMKRAQDQALQSRPYSVKLQSVIASLISSFTAFSHPLIRPNKNNQTLALVISTNRSLCGSLNTNLFRHLLDWTQPQIKDNLSFITVGKKGAEFITRLGQHLQEDYSSLPAKFTFADTLPISHQLMETYQQKKAGSVYIIYSDFISTLVQKPHIFQLLPIDPTVLKQTIELKGKITGSATDEELFMPKEYLIEPNAKKILAWLLPYFVELQVYHYLLEGAASEQSARMVAMKNATDNAKEIATDLTLIFNKARQAQITAEINEAAVASLTLSHEK